LSLNEFPLGDDSKFEIGQFCLKNQGSLENKEFGTSEEQNREERITISEVEKRITETLGSSKKSNDVKLESNKKEKNEKFEEFGVKKDVAHGALYRKLRREIADAYYGDGMAHLAKQKQKHALKYEILAPDVDSTENKKVNASTAKEKKNSERELGIMSSFPSFPTSKTDAIDKEKRKFVEYASLNEERAEENYAYKDKADKELWKSKADQSKREVEDLHERLENNIKKIKTSKFAKSDQEFLKQN